MRVTSWRLRDVLVIPPGGHDEKKGVDQCRRPPTKPRKTVPPYGASPRATALKRPCPHTAFERRSKKRPVEQFSRKKAISLDSRFPCPLWSTSGPSAEPCGGPRWGIGPRVSVPHGSLSQKLGTRSHCVKDRSRHGSPAMSPEETSKVQRENTGKAGAFGVD